jgi:IPT/TIG domain
MSIPKVTIDGIDATNIQVSSDGKTLTITTPAATSSGPKELKIITSKGTTTGIFNYTGDPDPSITSISPADALIAMSPSAIITGKYFSAPNIISSITIGGQEVDFTVESRTRITINNVPDIEEEGVYDIIMIANGNTIKLENAFTYYGVPSITTITPNEGSRNGDIDVVIIGHNLLFTSTITIYRDDGGRRVVKNLEILNISSSEVTATIPSFEPGESFITLRNKYHQFNKEEIIFTFIAAPVPRIESIEPSEGLALGGEDVTITGVNFGTPFGKPYTLTFDGVASPSSSFNADNTEIYAVTPECSTTGSKTVRFSNDGGVSNTTYTYNVPVISIDEVEKISSSPSGIKFDIFGSNLTGINSLSCGPSSEITKYSASLTPINNDSMTALFSPSIPSGTYDLRVQNKWGYLLRISDKITI